METDEVSVHQLRVFLFVKESQRWITAKEIAWGANVAPRTARAHALKLVQLEIFDVMEVSPAHRYRLSEKANRRNQAYLLRLQKAQEAFGLS